MSRGELFGRQYITMCDIRHSDIRHDQIALRGSVSLEDKFRTVFIRNIKVQTIYDSICVQTPESLGGIRTKIFQARFCQEY